MAEKSKSKRLGLTGHLADWAKGFLGGSTRQEQLDKQEAAAMATPAPAKKASPSGKSDVEKKAAKSVMDWINSGR